MWNIKKWFIGIILILYVSRVECDIFGELLMSVKNLHDKVDKISLEQETNREKISQMQEANNEKFAQLQNDLKNLLLEKESEGCPADWQYFDHTKKCYKRFTSTNIITWMDAQNTCKTHGGDLAIIHNEQTNKFVNVVAEGNLAWIGAIRVGPAPSQNDQFTWIDGTPMDYSKWGNPQPDNYKGIEICVHLLHNSGYWNDYDCNGASHNHLKIMDFVCQVAT